MQGKQPLPLHQHYSASSFAVMAYHDELAFNLPLTAANVADARFGDRFDCVHQMVVGVDSPIGYVLGTIAPHVDGMTYSLTGTDHARFSISSTGIITLTNPSGFSAGSKYFNVVNNVYGTIPVTVPVVNGSGAYRFYDSVNGDDANAGTQPHIPKKTLPIGTPSVSTTYLKRGSTFTKTGAITLSDNQSFKGYGDPAQPKPVVIETSNLTNNFEANSLNNIAFSDVEFRGGLRGLSCTTVSTLDIMRCTARGCGKDGNNNSQGIYVKGTNNPKIKHNEGYDCYGDGIYIVSTTGLTRGEIAYNYSNAPVGNAGDCIQVTGEGNISKINRGLWIHHNIGNYDAVLDSSKGAFVLQGSHQCLFEHNTAWGYYFGLSAGGTHNTIRHNYFAYSFCIPTNGNEFNFIGSETHTDNLKIYDNASMFTYRGFNMSGYGSELDRVDIDARYNTIMFCREASKSTERATTNIKKNIFCANYINSHTYAGRGNTVANVIANVTAFTNNGDGTGTFTTSNTHNHFDGDTTVVSGVSVAMDKTWTVLTALTNTTFKVSGVASEPTATGLTGTATKVRAYTTINDINADNTYQASVGTVIKTRPTISGTCADGQTVTASITLPTGHTAAYQWRLNDADISGATSAAYTVAAGTSATALNKFVPQHSNLNLPRLSCVILVTNPAGDESYVTAVWPDNEVYKIVVA